MENSKASCIVLFLLLLFLSYKKSEIIFLCGLHTEFIDEGVHPNGFTSPDLLHDDDDCSSRASSSDWTPQPHIGKFR